MEMQGDSGTTRTALVTGSTDGIGQHTAEKLAEDGWEVLIHGRNPKRIAATLERIKERVTKNEMQKITKNYMKKRYLKRRN